MKIQNLFSFLIDEFIKFFSDLSLETDNFSKRTPKKERESHERLAVFAMVLKKKWQYFLQSPNMTEYYLDQSN